MNLTLEELKRHVIVEDDIDDEYLLSLLATAEDAVRKNLNIKDEEELDSSSLHSILILAATLYDNRESVSYGSPSKVPHTFDYLIGLNKNYADDEGRTS